MRDMKRDAKPVRDPLARLFPYLLPVLLFLGMTGISRPFAVSAAAVCLVLSLGRGPMAQLRRRLSPLAGAVLLYALVCLCAGLWSRFGSYAGQESAKTLTALCVAGLVLCRVRDDGVRGLLASLDGAVATAALLCVDAASLQLLTRAFSALLGLTGSIYDLGTMGYEAGVRITGIFSNANVSAGVIAFGLVISLYLYQTAADEKRRLLTALALGIEALAFFLSFSMGAMGAFALTCLVYVLCVGKGRRLPLFLLMLESVAVTVVCAFAAYPFLGEDGVGIVPALACFVCGPAIWALDRFGGRRLLTVLEGRDKAVGVAAAALAGVVVVYAVLAVQVTGGMALVPGQTVSRAAYPAPGAYTLTYQGDSAQVTVYSQDEAQLMMHTNTVLYQGELSDAAFTVPEGARVVWFDLSGEGTLDSLTLSDGTEVPLGYPLLPGFAANRLQGLRANQNFIQRLVFFQDGIALWQQSPLIGWGLGGVEGQITAVQSFYYESKYIHDQFIQIMDEAGVVGLAAFCLLLGTAAVLLIRRRKSAAEDPFLPMMAACLTMMTAHSLTEVVWSTQVYQMTVFVLFAALVIHCHVPREGRHGRAAGRLAAVGLWGTVAVFALLQAGSLYAAVQFDRLASGRLQADPIATLQTLDRLEVYGDTDYKINLMVNGLRSGSTSDLGTAARCARELEESGEFNACYSAAAYYYLPLKQLPSFFQATRTGLAQEASNPSAWASVFHLYRQAFSQLSAEDMEDFLSGVVETGAYLEANNAGRMQPIVLEEADQSFLDLARSLEGAAPEEAYAALEAALAE